MKAVVTVIGKDMVGILAKVSQVCAEKNANVLEVTQSILDGYFCMVMIIDIKALECELEELAKAIRWAFRTWWYMLCMRYLQFLHRI